MLVGYSFRHGKTTIVYPRRLGSVSQSQASENHSPTNHRCQLTSDAMPPAYDLPTLRRTCSAYRKQTATTQVSQPIPILPRIIARGIACGMYSHALLDSALAPLREEASPSHNADCIQPTTTTNTTSAPLVHRPGISKLVT